MHLPMMKAAQEHEVGQPSLAAIRPVFDVVPINIVPVRATWEATPVLDSSEEGAADGWRNRASLAAYIERLAVLVFHHRNNACVAA